MVSSDCKQAYHMSTTKAAAASSAISCGDESNAKNYQNHCWPGILDGNDDGDNPANSSASKCIRLFLSTSYENNCNNGSDVVSFGPVFTHQCFPGEYIPGYKPKKASLTNCGSHASFKHHDIATHELCIDVTLAPSCQVCTVNIERKEVSKQEIEEANLIVYERSSKRPKHEEEIDIGSDDSDEEDDGEEDDEEYEEEIEDEETRNIPLTTEEIQKKLSKSLPPIEKDVREEERYLTQPIGLVWDEYSVNRNSVKIDFVLTLASGEQCVDYHNKVQKLALFYIETADDVDVSSRKDGGYWKVIYLFRKHQLKNERGKFKYSLVGYMTLYHFFSPFRKPVGGTVVRICQVLVLPPYQGSGHGRKMLHMVFDMTKKNMTDVVEVNVEDPAPAFVALRDRVDYERFLQLKMNWFDEMNTDENQGNLLDDTNFFVPLAESDALNITKQSCTTSRQVQIVYELHKLQSLQSYTSKNSLTNESKEKLDKRYRLMVKHRLNKQEREILGSLGSKQDMKDTLAKLYEEIFKHYTSILCKVHRTN